MAIVWNMEYGYCMEFSFCLVMEYGIWLLYGIFIFVVLFFVLPCVLPFFSGVQLSIVKWLLYGIQAVEYVPRLEAAAQRILARK